MVQYCRIPKGIIGKCAMYSTRLRKGAVMLQHFVEFSVKAEVPGLWGSHEGTTTEVSVLVERDLEEVRLITPEGAYAFRFFDQNVVKCEDGEVLYGEKKNWSGCYYYGNGPFTREELLVGEKAKEYEKQLEIWEAIHAHNELEKQWKENVWNGNEKRQKFPNYFTITEDGGIHPLYPEDCVIEL